MTTFAASRAFHRATVARHSRVPPRVTASQRSSRPTMPESRPIARAIALTPAPAAGGPRSPHTPRRTDSGVLRVFRALVMSGVSGVWGRGSIMSAPEYSAEFTEQVVPRDRSTVPSGGRGREALRAGLLRTVGVRVAGRRTEHPRARGRGNSSNAGGCWRPRRLKAEPPARPGARGRAPRGKRRPSSAPGAPGEHHGRIHPRRRRRLSRPAPCPGGGGSSPGPAVTPGAAGPARRQPGGDRTPAATGTRFFDGSEQTCGHRPHARAGPRPSRGPGRRARAPPAVMAANDMAPLQAQAGKARHRGPGPRTFQAGRGRPPQESRRRRACGDTRVGDITCVPTWQRGFASPGHGHGAAPGKKIIGHTRGRSHAAPG